MNIGFALRRNHLTSDPDDHYADVKPSGTVTQDELIGRMLDAGTTLTRTDIEGVFRLMEQETKSALREGFNVETGLVVFSVGINGVFKNDQDNFDRTRHKPDVNLRKGRELSNSLFEDVTFERIAETVDKSAPTPVKFNDFVSQQTNQVITPGGIGQIYGHRLKVDGEDENQGVFFVSEDGNKFRVPRLVTNTPSQLIFPIPELAPGHYTIEVNAIFRGRSNLRTGELPDTLEVLQ